MIALVSAYEDNTFSVDRYHFLKEAGSSMNILRQEGNGIF